MENYRILFENEDYILGHIFKTVVLIIKKTNEKIHITEQYGDPTCGLIIYDNCIIGGIELAIYNIKSKRLYIIENEELQNIYAMKILNTNTIKILTDPWSEKSALWELDLDKVEVNKIRKFDGYFNKPYEENIKY